MSKFLMIYLVLRLSLSSQNMEEDSVTVSRFILVHHRLNLFLHKSEKNDKVIYPRNIYCTSY